MKLIVGLGNPEERYKNNRHNVGHIVIDKLKAKGEKLKGVVVVKTDTFMNNSGSFIKKLTSAYSLVPSALYVVHDDLDIPLGSYKIQLGRGPKDHRGLESIDEALGNRDYWHVRVGIENRAQRLEISGEEYVLQDFTDVEATKVEEVVGKVVDELCKKLATS